MNRNDLAQLKRRLSQKNDSPSAVMRGLYFTSEGRMISSMRLSAFDMTEEDRKNYFSLFRKALGGTWGKNLLEVDFPQEEVMDGGNYTMLSTLRDEALDDEEHFLAFARQVTDSLKPYGSDTAENYLLLMMYDVFDVPARHEDGAIDEYRSENVFRWIECCLCPVKLAKSTLSYDPEGGGFFTRDAEWTVSSPLSGFSFPAYEDGQANISRALYYTSDAADIHEGFLMNTLGVELSSPRERTDTYNRVLLDAVGDEMDIGLVKAMSGAVSEMIKENDSDKNNEPLRFTKEAISRILEDCGVSEGAVKAFDEYYSETFSAAEEMDAVNLAETGKFRINTPSVSINVAPENSHLVETRIINGIKYVLVMVDGLVEVNGIPIKIND